MPRVHTHYDNLKVSRDAPIEVIRAAFKSLAAKYHPDVNPGSAEAAGIMRIINASYEVISDPEKRAEHNRWIASVEGNPVGSGPINPKPRASEWRSQAQPPVFVQPWSAADSKWMVWVIGIILSVAIATVFVSNDPRRLQSNNHSASTFPAAAQPTAYPKSSAQREHYALPPLDPYGQPWPTVSGYLIGYLSEPGNSVVTVDNTQNSSDMRVKLFDRGLKDPACVRDLFLRAHDRFTLKNVRPGNYDLRFRDLDSGLTMKGEPFSLKESQENVTEVDGVRHITHFSRYSLTLYEVPDGNTHTEIIGPDDFGTP